MIYQHLNFKVLCTTSESQDEDLNSSLSIDLYRNGVYVSSALLLDFHIEDTSLCYASESFYLL